jgi:hypothetical protein
MYLWQDYVTICGPAGHSRSDQRSPAHMRRAFIHHAHMVTINLLRANYSQVSLLNLHCGNSAVPIWNYD